MVIAVMSAAGKSIGHASGKIVDRDGDLAIRLCADLGESPD